MHLKLRNILMKSGTLGKLGNFVIVKLIMLVSSYKYHSLFMQESLKTSLI